MNPFLAPSRVTSRAAIVHLSRGASALGPGSIANRKSSLKFLIVLVAALGWARTVCAQAACSRRYWMLPGRSRMTRRNMSIAAVCISASTVLHLESTPCERGAFESCSRLSRAEASTSYPDRASHQIRTQ